MTASGFLVEILRRVAPQNDRERLRHRRIGVKGIISLSVSKGGKPLAGVDRVHERSDFCKQNVRFAFIYSALADIGVSHLIFEILLR